MTTENKVLRLLRVFSDIKQKDFARLIEIEVGELSNIERGKRAVTENRLEQYATVFKCSREDLQGLIERCDQAKSQDGFHREMFRFLETTF